MAVDSFSWHNRDNPDITAYGKHPYEIVQFINNILLTTQETILESLGQKICMPPLIPSCNKEQLSEMTPNNGLPQTSIIDKWCDRKKKLNNRFMTSHNYRAHEIDY